MQQQIPIKQAEIRAFSKEHGSKSLGNITVASALGGMRGLNCMFWDLSKLDAEEGIRFRGHTLYDAVNALRPKEGGEVKPEQVFWLLLTGNLPTKEETNEFIGDLRSRMKLDDETTELVTKLPKGLHPMAKLSTGMLLLQKNSKFAEAYSKGVNKKDLWEYMLEDSLNLVAQTFTLGALIHNTHYNEGSSNLTVNPNQCLTDN